MRTLVVQSHRPDACTGWLKRCLVSVEAWARDCGHDYRFLGDEALRSTPDWYRDKLGERKPIVADLARLLLIRQALADGYQRACWIDADVLLFAPEHLNLDFPGTCAFGREHWVAAGSGGRLRVRRNVHNAICAFTTGCPVLPFLIHATERIIRRVDPVRIAPQMVGPKLLGALHNIVGFDLIESVGAFSPAVIDALSRGGGPAVEMLRKQSPRALAGANLCGSLNAHRDLGDVCDRLLLSGLPE